jgi:hypothetical protein
MRMKLRLARDVSLTVVDSGAVLLDGRRGRYWQLNATGSAVLSRLLDGDTPAEVAAGLEEVAQVSDGTARQDVMALIETLRASRLVEVTS